MHTRKWTRTAAATLFAIAATSTVASAQGRRFDVSIAPGVHNGPITGRLIVIASTQDKPEPRARTSPAGAAVFGIDLNQVKPGQTTVVDNKSSLGYPTQLAELPEGDYYVQAVVNVYEQVHRSDGHSIWVHMNDGRIEWFGYAEGNLYSDVQKVHIGKNATVKISLDHVNPAPERPKDTEWIKYVRIQSQKLTKFWGRPVYVNAFVLLPKGYAEHPNVRYPSVYSLGHGDTPFSFSTTPSEQRRGGESNPLQMRRGAEINPNSGLESGYDFYKQWVSDDFPRFIAITLQQQTPYFADSYSVNSANNGPYGDAIVQEIIPELERQFRIISKPYARHVEGASTSGWQTLALQLQHPDFFGNAWVLQPDPIDFRNYQLTDIYADSNAFSVQTGQLTSTERYFQRSVEGQPITTTRALSRFEAVLGSHGRSGYQLEAWEAVYGPIGADGYPVPLWDKLTGKIDHKVADYMRDHGFDLTHYLQTNWATLGPKLQGKLHFFCGDMDNYYLNLAVYRMEDFLKSTANPHSDADFTYGRPKKGHGWHSYTWAEMVQKMAAATKAHAPAGEDTGSWNY